MRISEIDRQAYLSKTLCLYMLFICYSTEGHEKTRNLALKNQANFELELPTETKSGSKGKKAKDSCYLTLAIKDANGQESLPALVRISDVNKRKAISLDGEILRADNWFSLGANSTVTVPCTKIEIEALRGPASKLATLELNLENNPKLTAVIEIERFCDPHENRLYSSNTHLHLNDMNAEEALNYLRIVSRSDELDIVFLSYLARKNPSSFIPDDRSYISNTLVERAFKDNGFGINSKVNALFANGQEHRNDFIPTNGKYQPGYGHVIFLDIEKNVGFFADRFKV